LEVEIESVRLVDNVADSRHTSFYVDPEVQYRLMMEEEDRGRALVCIFHSHPAPPRPSSSDLRNMRLNPIVWLIASKVSGTWKTGAFILLEDEVTPVRILSEDS
jgi:proteasome lid subunit RPN8/RPN11